MFSSFDVIFFPVHFMKLQTSLVPGKLYDGLAISRTIIIVEYACAPFVIRLIAAGVYQ